MIVDTSSILFGLRHRKDVFQSIGRELPSCTPVVSRGIVGELRAISGNRGRRGSDARAALLLLKSKKVDMHNIRAGVDDWILKEAATRGEIVVTNDTELAGRLVGNGVTCFKLSVNGRLRRY